ncbi:hypothetical protein BD410DRAFT_709553 [Rickenella mellea]|uniref:C3H1-type domain-containing protein n=1 Tax=Rickenella mellea TaxID=50990 RepID=A0A4R5XDU9_9AGAM|nr:hypothetical protein BD410DRAFT_709553 [Rickenella mellea]
MVSEGPGKSSDYTKNIFFLDLSSATIQKNIELTTRVSELEEELAVWKQARSATVDTAEREKRVYDDQVTLLKKRVAVLEAVHSPQEDSMILCVIDGSGNFFSESFLSAGQQGGRAAAQCLAKGIAQYLHNEKIQPRGRFSFWVSLYFDRQGWSKSLVARGICTAVEFEAFLVGFSEASPYFLLVDVGYEKDATSVKVKEYLQTYTRFPQTIKVFFGGNDATYLPAFSALDNAKLLDKIIVLKGRNNLPAGLSSLLVPTLEIDNLFMSQKPSNNVVPTSTAQMVARESSTIDTTMDGVLSSPSPPLIPLHKQDPPPCNEHYLMTCNKGALCKYSHEYVLSPEQLSTLATNAKKAPCNFLRHGLQCPYGEQCCWGHVCPRGTSCFHYSKGKCWFKGGENGRRLMSSNLTTYGNTSADMHGEILPN